MNPHNQQLIEEVFRKARITEKLADSTIYKYRDSAKQFFLTVGNKKIEDLALKDFDDFVLKMKDKEASSKRICDIISAMKRIISDLQIKNLVPRNLDVNSIEKPKVKHKQMEYLSEEEVKRFIEAVASDKKDRKLNKARMLALINFMLQTGARIGEALSINTSDIDRQNMEIKMIGKGKKTRTLFLRRATLYWIDNYLKKRKDNNEFLFAAQSGKSRWTQTDFGRCFRRYIKQLGINKRIVSHTMRHTCATQLASKGVPFNKIQRILGHERLETTVKYYIGAIEDKRIKEEIIMNDKYFDFIPREILGEL